MRHAGRTVALAALVLGAAVGTAAASTPLFVPSPSHFGGTGPPIIAGDHIVWGTDSGRRITVRSVPLAGAPARTLVQLEESLFDWTLAASSTTVAIRDNDELFVAHGAGFGAATKLGSAPLFTLPLAVAGDDVVTVEEAGAIAVVNRPPGAAPSKIPLPPGARAETLAVAGAHVAVAIGKEGSETAVALIDRHSGTEVRRIAIPAAPIVGAPDKERLSAGQLALGADGAVAITGPASTTIGAPWVGWAPSGATTFSAVRLTSANRGGPVIGTLADAASVAVANGRLAYTGGGSLGRSGGLVYSRPGRIEVVALPPVPPAPGDAPPVAPPLYRSPPSASFDGLSFDGDRLAWAGASCALVTAVPAPPEQRSPPGPCFRAEISAVDAALAGRNWVIPLTCVTTVGSRCRGDLSLRVFGHDVGAVRVRIAIGSVRRVHVRLPRALATRLRAAKCRGCHVQATVRLSDGAGHVKRVTLHTLLSDV